MTPAQFVTRAVEAPVPWVRWASDWSGADCYGLIVLYFREVLGLDLGLVPRSDLACGFAQAQGWVECDLSDGAIAFMSWSEGAPTHCGIVFSGGFLLHSEGNEAMGGRVRLTRMPAMRRSYPDLRFYRFCP